MSKLSSKIFYFLAFLLLLALLFFLPEGRQQRLRELLALASSPAKTLAEIGARVSREALGGLPENFSLEERDALLQDLAQTRIELHAAQNDSERLRQDNITLQTLLRLQRSPKTHTLIVCRVLRRYPLSDYYGSILIDRGHSDGLKPGHAVLSPEGLVGIVAQTTAKESQVTLVGSPRLSLSCKLAKKNIAALIHGPARAANSSADLFLPPQDMLLDSLSGDDFDSVNEGDWVLTSSLGSENLLDDIPIGRVSASETDNAGAKRYQVHPAAGLENLRYVLVAIP
ncbi:MAG: rod shape-determining protein MreC [Lentisphaeria bacterium]|nr:rod shape-determining protein MreC [Lentisphaeria bacterium]MDY0177542.1 rod shape-determining protein MreC [Lentisphaeria bacterium]NLZ60638.1 rod shape-determining protein MreC [Lentisphaerota bacterium]